MLYYAIFRKQTADRLGALISLEYKKIITKSETNIRSHSTMSDWKIKKREFLEMDVENKRRNYRCGSNFKTVHDLPTWESYFHERSPLPEKHAILGGFVVDASKNKDIAKKISLFNGDITTLEVDAIVNAANTTLLGGGGVDGAIHRAAGSELKEECKTLEGCKTGEAKITGAYRLPAKYVIHTVGPQREKPDLLTLCYRNCLNIMQQQNLKTIAFPCVSTGIYGYPIDKAAQIACRQVRTFLEENHASIERVIFCLFGPEDVDMYERTCQSYFPVSGTE